MGHPPKDCLSVVESPGGHPPDIAPFQLLGLGSAIFSTCPNPIGGGPNPKFETYRFPSGPKVMAVGSDSADVLPLAINVYLFLPSTRRIWAVLGVGNGLPVVFSST